MADRVLLPSASGKARSQGSKKVVSETSRFRLPSSPGSIIVGHGFSIDSTWPGALGSVSNRDLELLRSLARGWAPIFQFNSDHDKYMMACLEFSRRCGRRTL